MEIRKRTRGKLREAGRHWRPAGPLHSLLLHHGAQTLTFCLSSRTWYLPFVSKVLSTSTLGFLHRLQSGYMCVASVHLPTGEVCRQQLPVLVTSFLSGVFLLFLVGCH